LAGDVHMGYEEDRPAVFCRNANRLGLQFQNQLNYQIINKIEI